MALLALKLGMAAGNDGPPRSVLFLPVRRQTATRARRLNLRYIIYRIYEERVDVAATPMTSPEGRRFTRMRGRPDPDSVPQLVDQSFIVSMQSSKLLL